MVRGYKNSELMSIGKQKKVKKMSQVFINSYIYIYINELNISINSNLLTLIRYSGRYLTDYLRKASGMIVVLSLNVLCYVRRKG